MSIKTKNAFFTALRCGCFGNPREVVSRPPTPGEHTDRVRADYGYDAEAIAALRKGGII